MIGNQRVALVTGASRGIGRAIAQFLGQGGLKVAVNYRRDEASAGAVVDLIRSAGGEAHAFAADVGDPHEAERLVHDVTDHFGELHVLVNNAGITRDNLMLRMKQEEWDEVLATDLSGAFHCTKAALRGMVRQRYGRIVNIASVAGIVGNAGQANYAAAKAGLIGLTRALAREVASRGITVNAVAPGLIDTELSRTVSDRAGEALLEHIPLGRMGRPEEIAEAVWYLVQAEYVTGQVLVVDGGLAMQ
jgi:3-oxoacyl-[acyl-carrier protein] reductase